MAIAYCYEVELRVKKPDGDVIETSEVYAYTASDAFSQCALTMSGKHPTATGVDVVRVCPPLRFHASESSREVAQLLSDALRRDGSRQKVRP
jgi:hypothetical protein